MSERNASGGNPSSGRCAGLSGNPPPSGISADIGEAVAELEAGAYLIMASSSESGGGVGNPTK